MGNGGGTQGLVVRGGKVGASTQGPWCHKHCSFHRLCFHTGYQFFSGGQLRQPLKMQAEIEKTLFVIGNERIEDTW